MEWFESNVKLYVIQTAEYNRSGTYLFESNVKLYVIQTAISLSPLMTRLRVM